VADKCMMDQYDTPMIPPHGGDERFYVVVMQELTIYGHTVDAYTKANFPEDWEHTEALMAIGQEYGCWHSVACRDGELGSWDKRALKQISHDEFLQARDDDWPELADQPITQPGPVSAVGYVDKDGNYVDERRRWTARRLARHRDQHSSQAQGRVRRSDAR
jgi:hypothetical protein